MPNVPDSVKKLTKRLMWRIGLVFAAALVAALAALFVFIILLPRNFTLGWTYVLTSAGIIFVITFFYLIMQFARDGWGDD